MTNEIRFDPETGYALSADHQRIAEIIQDYDPCLELAWIPPDQRNENDRQPFAVLHRAIPGGPVDYVVFRLAENEVDHRVLARLFSGDNSKQNVLESIESSEAAFKLLELKRELDAREERKEIAAWAIKARPGATLAKGVRLE